MPRPHRFDEPHGFYHVTQRGMDGLVLFGSDDDRMSFLSLVSRVAAREKWRCFAYCLMTTHYHLVLQIGDERMARGMQWLSGTYARRFNERRARHGFVFGGRYRLTAINDEEHLWEACRYVELNPVRAGLCAREEDWLWSSYRAYAGHEPRPPFLCDRS